MLSLLGKLFEQRALLCRLDILAPAVPAAALAWRPHQVLHAAGAAQQRLVRQGVQVSSIVIVAFRCCSCKPDYDVLRELLSSGLSGKVYR
jgi:hypothetical protein